MSITQKRVYDKLFSHNLKVEKKHNFKRNHKVSLSKIDELDNIADSLIDVYETAQHREEEGYAMVKSAFDMMREEAWSPLVDLKDELQKTKDGLDSLGIEYPSNIENLDNKVYEIEQEVNRIFKNFESYGLFT